MSNTLKTADEIRAAGVAARDFIARHHLCLDATIEDYPIGRHDRGKCRLQVERKKGHGYRLVRTTIDKHGRWCKPHKSQYSDACVVMIDDYNEDRKAVWLKVDPRYGVFVQHADYSGFALIKVDFCSTPSRVERRYTWTSTKLAITRAGLEAEEAPSQEVSVYPRTRPSFAMPTMPGWKSTGRSVGSSKPCGPTAVSRLDIRRLVQLVRALPRSPCGGLLLFREEFILCRTTAIRPRS
jgi:hypothetical protein